MSSPVRHVALNALFLAPNASGGPETYMRGLVPALVSEFPDTRFTVITTRAGAARLRADRWTDFVGIEELPADEGETAKRTWAEQVLLPRRARAIGADVLHSLASVAPVMPRMPAVITVHDVTFLRIRTFGAVTTAGMRAIITTAARRADGLVAISAGARDEIADRLGIAPDRFVVAHNGAGRTPSVEPSPADAVRERFGVSKPRTVICVGAKRPHKNQELLIQALPHLPEDVGLVLAGHAEPYEERLRELVAAGGHDGRVAMPGYVSDADLEGLWRLSSCAAFPTLGEGFGLPIVEAMGRGVPVACSDIDVLREVGGDVPHYFDPHDPADAARAVLEAMDDRDAAARGPERAATFTWENSARGTFEAYERALR